MFELYDTVKTKIDVSCKNEDGQAVTAPKGTYGTIVELYDDSCLLEFADNDDGHLPIVYDYKLTDIEFVWR